MRAEVKGWCPSAYRPMMSGDGLVVRVRPPFGRVSAKQAIGLGDLALCHGNGEITATSRLNLQLRGVSERNFESVLNALQELCLIDETPETEARGNILIAPQRKSSEAEAFAQAIAVGLVERQALPSKFGIVVDIERSGRQLANVSGDIRVERGETGLIVRADGLATGRKSDDPVADVLELADWFLVNGVGPDGRGRMRQAADRLGSEWHGVSPRDVAEALRPGIHPEGLVVAGEFGAFPASAFQHATGDIIPLPGKYLLLCDVAEGPEGVISDANNPLLSVMACVGAPACEQAQVETRAFARKLAGQEVHVSGCDKGCAYQGTSDTTLIGRNGRFDLVKYGRASDTPVKQGLTPEEAIKELGGA